MSEMKEIEIRAMTTALIGNAIVITCESCRDAIRCSSPLEASRKVEEHMDVEHDVDLRRLGDNYTFNGAELALRGWAVYKTFKGWAVECRMCNCKWYFRTYEMAKEALMDHLELAHSLNAPRLEMRGCITEKDAFDKISA